MPALLLPLLAKYAWPWAVFAVLLGVIGYEKLAMSHRARIIVEQQAALDQAASLGRARELEKQALVLSIESQNRAVEELRAASAKESVAVVERVRTVIVRDRQKFSPKNAQELTNWIRANFTGF